VTSGDPIGAQLAQWGTVAMVTTIGRVTGRDVETAVGYIEEADGSLLVAAGSPDAGWARNLEAEPRGRARIAERELRFVAEELAGAEAAAAVGGLIVRYGTPAEGLGRGPVFRLRRIDPDDPA
jgi:deazaflavin-dependent oxidoreductase (nitroreductase family)